MQPFTKTTLFASSALALALGLCSAPVWADSTSSASSAASTSVGSSSTSLETSSASSSGKGQVAQGNYTVVDVAAVAGMPDLLRVRLQAAAPGLTAEFALLIPRQNLDRTHLTTGQTVHAEHRPYGLAFALVAADGAGTTNAQPFFLVLDDAWHRELESRPVGSAAPAATI
ncbi:MAG: hypothetical protein CFE43_16135 [Burkholderiales bacterium PBB3]|nr:MAG: hypothetical protein CFE43_16135 [Burkholderiales bacterium PBB3]